MVKPTKNQTPADEVKAEEPIAPVDAEVQATDAPADEVKADDMNDPLPDDMLADPPAPEAAPEPVVEVKAEPKEEPKAKAPAAVRPRLVCLVPFEQFGSKFAEGDEVLADPTWPEGTVERRIEYGFVKFKV